MKIKGYISTIAIVSIISSLTLALPTFAETTNKSRETKEKENRTEIRTASSSQMMGRNYNNGFMMKPIVVGIVTSVTGSNITIDGRSLSLERERNATQPATTTYTIDASSATIHKNNATSTIASIIIGDTLSVQGTISGTSIKATFIRDGTVGRGLLGQNYGMMRNGNDDKEDHGRNSTTTPGTINSPITGNGQPVVAGTVSSVSSSTIVITNKSNISYTVDASNAKIVQGTDTITISGISVGDSIIAQGAVTGNSIIASSIIDEKNRLANINPSLQNRGIFGSIGKFFMNIFGF